MSLILFYYKLKKKMVFNLGVFHCLSKSAPAKKLVLFLPILGKDFIRFFW